MTNNGKAPLSVAILSFVLLFLGLALKSVENQYSTYIFYASFIIGGIFWIWSIISLAGTKYLKPYQKSFWLIVVIAVPFFGAFIFRIMQQRRNKIAA